MDTLNTYRITFTSDGVNTSHCLINASDEKEARRKFNLENPTCDIIKVEKEKEPSFHDSLRSLKEQLFDAPSEIKEAFNTVVGYFDNKKDLNPPFYSKSGVVVAISDDVVYIKDENGNISEHKRIKGAFKPKHETPNEWRRWYNLFPENETK